MRIGIIGAGAVGGVIAALLDKAGHDVEVAARGAQLDAIRASGLQLDGAWGSHVARVAANETLTLTADLIILTTKAQDARAALHANNALVNGTPLLVVQNGLAGIRVAREGCPDSPVAGALALFAASFVAPGRVTVTAGAATYIGGESPPGRATELSTQALSGAIPLAILDSASEGTRSASADPSVSSLDGEFVGAQWTKLIVNQINALPAITGLSAQDVIGNRQLRRIMTASMREAVRVGLSAGVRFGSLLGLNHSLLTAFSRLPLWIGQTLPRELARRMGDTPNPGSTLQSINRGQTTEIDYLNGAVVDTAIVASAKAPVNTALVTLVHEVEARGSFYSPAEVAARVSLHR
jgi:2-dehydropantoate 2-reductase